MEQILVTKTRSAWAAQLDRPFALNSPFQGEDFALLLAVRDTTITAAEQAALSEAIVSQGCRYAVCTGHECSTWDDSIDMAYIATDPNLDPPDSTFVMTTWHENESLEEVAWYFSRLARFDGFEPSRFLVVCLGGDRESYADARDTVRAQLRLASA